MSPKMLVSSMHMTKLECMYILEFISNNCTCIVYMYASPKLLNLLCLVAPYRKTPEGQGGQ